MAGEAVIREDGANVPVEFDVLPEIASGVQEDGHAKCSHRLPKRHSVLPLSEIIYILHMVAVNL
jgi:hypothetical protein